jgi:bifunctional UDP-N-acetylglucosamine pyrophosphorylase/glucosamine-1-phosphate N-acetyltransferase
VEDDSETLGVNDRIALSQAEAIIRKRIMHHHMRNGVTIVDANNTYIDVDVTIGQDTVIYPGTMIRGKTDIGPNCTIGPNTEIQNCRIGEATTIRQSAAFDSSIGKNVQVGPFAHIRPSSEIMDEVKLGNFVEIKKSTIGKNTKVPHLSYIGDTQIGSDTNIGCGAITVNYDGIQKFTTTIGDRVFIGCNVNLIAPVEIESDSYVAAGSTITTKVPKGTLAIARSRQENKEGYLEKLKKKK